ncbi:MAG: GDP-mannose 4,6-dehydratase [Candidatus Heimdallarchaeaceae archaeon]
MIVDRSKIIEECLERINRRLKKKEISFENQNILVTGGAGFLGSWICDILIKQNANVVAIDNFASGDLQNIKHLIDNSDNFKFIEHDITKPLYLQEDIDLILHFASRANPLDYSEYPIETLKANSFGTWVVLGIAKKKNARLLYASTSEIYGNPDPSFVPTPETYYGYVNPVGPRSCYDESKRFGETITFIYHLEHGIDTRIARIFNTYGPRMMFGRVVGRAIPRFVTQALLNLPISIFGDGLQTRSFTFVEDEIVGLLNFAYQDGLSGEVINIGNSKEWTIREVISLIKKITNSSSEIQFFPMPRNDPIRRAADGTKAKRLLNWEPEISLEAGLRKTINWFKNKLDGYSDEYVEAIYIEYNKAMEKNNKLLEKLL